MGKFVTRLIVVCNVDGAKSANGKIRYALFVKPSQVNQLVQSLNQYTYTWVQSSHVGVLKGNPRKVACMLCECVKCIRQTIADNIKRLTAQTVIGELSGLFIGIRAPRGYPDCLKTVSAVSVSNSYQRIFGYSNYPPRLSQELALWTHKGN